MKQTMKATTTVMQTVPLEISRYYRERLPSGKPGELRWSDGPPRKDTPGMERRHFTVKRVRVGTTLPDMFAAIAKELRTPIEELLFNVRAQPERISIVAHAPGGRYVAGRLASVAIRGLVSPCQWRKVDRPSPWDWRNLPDALDNMQRYRASFILSLFTAEEIAGPWRWRKPTARTQRQQMSTKVVKLTLKLMNLRHLTDRDFAAIDALIKKVRTRRAA